MVVEFTASSSRQFVQVGYPQIASPLMAAVRLDPTTGYTSRLPSVSPICSRCACVQSSPKDVGFVPTCANVLRVGLKSSLRPA